MSAAYKTTDLVVKRGTDFAETVTYYSDEDQTNLVNLTGYSANFRVRVNYDTDGALLVDLSSGSGLTLGGAAGTIAIAITSTATALLRPGRYKYDLTITSGGGVVEPLMDGELVVLPRVAP